MRVGYPAGPDVFGYRAGDLEELADLVHPMAAVAWDRDMADVRLLESPDLKFALRFRPTEVFAHNETLRRRVWVACTGESGHAVARWDRVSARWVRS